MQKKLHVLILFVLFTFVTPHIVHGQTEYQKPALSNPDSWSLILIPDPQSYVKFERNQPLLELMMNWIKENRTQLNTKMVLCTGDLVEHNNLIAPDEARKANQNSAQQWTASRKAFSILDHQVPYILATGNHDYGDASAEYRSTQYDKYFAPEQNSLNLEALRETGPKLDETPSSVNAIYEFRPTADRKILVMVLEFGPRDEVVDWAKSVVDNPKYADHEVIVLTHVYLNRKSEHIVNQNYKIADVNYGEALFKKLVQPSKNIRMVFSGHIGSPDDFDGHLGYREDKNAAGKTVHQMTFNAQAMGGGWYGNGGDGWLRYLEFLPDGKTVNVKTFSPLFAISPSTQHLAYQQGADQEFTFVLD